MAKLTMKSFIHAHLQKSVTPSESHLPTGGAEGAQGEPEDGGLHQFLPAFADDIPPGFVLDPQSSPSVLFWLPQLPVRKPSFLQVHQRANASLAAEDHEQQD